MTVAGTTGPPGQHGQRKAAGTDTRRGCSTPPFERSDPPALSRRIAPMSRINTNISAMQSYHRLQKNNSELTTRLQRLSTGLKINAGKDAPAGLIASETLRSEINGINQAIDNSQRANNVVNTAEGALSEVSSLLLELQGLTIQAANTGALSKEEIEANQLQADAIVNSINRISNTTQFGGVKLLNGTLDYTTSNVDATKIDIVNVNAAKLPDNGNV